MLSFNKGSGTFNITLEKIVSVICKLRHFLMPLAMEEKSKRIMCECTLHVPLDKSLFAGKIMNLIKHREVVGLITRILMMC